MRRAFLIVFAVSSVVLLLGCSTSGQLSSGSVQRVSKEHLSTLLDDPGTVIIDVRLGRDWRESDRKITGAVREDPTSEESSWAGKYQKDKNIVLY
jgi:rhodanese-related sulfurtransferase